MSEDNLPPPGNSDLEDEVEEWNVGQIQGINLVRDWVCMTPSKAITHNFFLLKYLFFYPTWSLVYNFS